MRDDDRLEAVLRELHADRVRRTLRWELIKIAANATIVVLLVGGLFVAMARSQAAQDERAARLHESVNALWRRVDEISGASAAP